MLRTKCIIVDDEPIAIRIIKNYLSKFDEFELVAECGDALSVIKILRTEPIDLIFLDIEMPVLSGLEMLKTLSVQPKIIFTTAHRKYAVEAFEVDALDYLLKPISFDRFTQAINRYLQSKVVLNSVDIKEKTFSLVVKSEKKYVKIESAQITYVESLSDYVIIHTENQKSVTKERISALEKKLADYGFLRVHRGFLINKNKVTAWYGSTLELGDIKIPIGRNYKESVHRYFSE